MNKPSTSYYQDSVDGVWQRTDQQKFLYSDGDEVEDRIAAIVGSSSNLSVLSTELRSHITDWASNYHLSPQRANLLRPLKQQVAGSVLEIGSGCGAITRFLGENSASVVALEGSRRRAHITRTRTRDLHNVSVFCDEFSAFETDQRFDAVTLIGVLEYANLFVNGPNPAHSMLVRANELLSDSGCLILAIENQLGLKYFAGSPEDHLNFPMVGLEDQYSERGVRTYGKRVLIELLRSSGFSEVECLYPFPDYKMPTSIISDHGLNHPIFDPTPLLVATANKDQQIPEEPGFSLERAWPVLAKNGLVSDLSNSFLLIARRNKTSTPQTHNLAWHYSTERRPEFCKETLFKSSPDGKSVQIERKLLLAEPQTIKSSAPLLQHDHEDDTPYSARPLLNSVLIDIVTRQDWTFNQVAGFIRQYAVHLEKISGIQLSKDNIIFWDATIPGNLFDCIPQNIYLNDGSINDYQAFDLEWAINEKTTFTHMAFRSLWHTIGNISKLGVTENNLAVSLLDLIRFAMVAAGKNLTDGEVTLLVKQEISFSELATGESRSFEDVFQWIANKKLASINTHQALIAQKKKTEEFEHRLFEINQHSERLEQQNRDLLKQCSALEQHGKNLEQLLKPLQLQVPELSSAMRLESLNSHHAIRELAQLSARHYLHERTAKNLLKQFLEYREVQALQQRGDEKSLWSDVFEFLTVCKNFFHTRPQLIVEHRAVASELTIGLMKQSCHWALPYIWNVSCAAHQTADEIARASIALGLRCDFNVSDIYSLLPKGYIVGFFRLISFNPGRPITAWPTIDPEMVRKAYLAMASDSTIAMVYVGASLIDKVSTETPINLLCLMRPHLGTLSISAFYQLPQQVESLELLTEIETHAKALEQHGLNIKTL